MNFVTVFHAKGKNMISNLKERIIYKFTIWSLKFKQDNSGISSIEMVLLILVILGIIVLFRDYIKNLINTVFSKIDNQISSF